MFLSAGIAAFAAALLEEIAARIRLYEDHFVTVGASIGIAFAPKHGEVAEALLDAADEALYRAKAAGQQRHAIAD